MAKRKRSLKTLTRSIRALDDLAVVEALTAATQLMRLNNLPELIGVLGMEALLALSCALPGRKITIPTPSQIVRAVEVVQAILEAKAGLCSLDKICARYKISPSNLDKLIKAYDGILRASRG